MSRPEFKWNLKLFVILFAVILSISTISLMWIEHNNDLADLEEQKTKEQWAVQMESTLIHNRLNMLISDISYLHEAYGPQLANTGNYDRIAQEWMSFSNKRGIYDQIRYLDANGNEKIRIDFKEDGAVRIRENELQNKIDRYYFYEAVALQDNSIHISPLDLNIEHGEVEVPYKPMIRLGMPIYENGQLQGLIVINYLAADFLNIFKRCDQTTIGHIMLLNDAGYYLSTFNEQDEWGFMFPDKKDRNFAVDHPDVWQKMTHGTHYTLDNDGMFTSLPMMPYELSLKQNANKFLPKNIYSTNQWYIVSWIPREPQNDFLYYDDMGHLLKQSSTQMIFPLLLIIALLLAWIGSEGFRHYRNINHRAEFDLLTQAYSREGGMFKLTGLHRAITLSRNKMAICFVDVNGLKTINDKLGHTFGDEMITTTVTILQSEIRRNDFIIRMGGDEFIIVLPYVDQEQAEAIWIRIKSSLDAHNENNDRPYLISLSHGIVDNQGTPELTLDEMIEAADQKMYAEKLEIKKNFSSIRQPDTH